MIIVKLKGGLGNQMFQYACAKSLALHKGVPLLLDLSLLIESQKVTVGTTPRNFELHVFGITGLITQSELGIIFEDAIRKGYKYLYFKEPLGQYYEGLSRLGNRIIIEGYFQDERYFAAFNPEIRDLFCFQTPSTALNEQLSLEIGSRSSIAVHIRRGDYLSPSCLSVFAPCPPDYYRAAVEYMRSSIASPFFYVFCSDDHEWADSLFRKLGVAFKVLKHNIGGSSFEDMRLMSLCKHAIIANSSFSWWGAWLNANPKKLVLYPSQWYLPATRMANPALPAWIGIQNIQ